LSTEEQANAPQTYRIGAVSRLTGVPTDTLRVWERRYSVVTPVRTRAGTRLYRSEDIGRLTLIKQLVDRGDAISSVAGLDMDQLRERLRGTGLPSAEALAKRPCRLAVLGGTLAQRMADARDQLDGLDLVGTFDDRQHFVAEAASLTPDLVILEYRTIHAEQVREIADLLARSGAARALVVYNFATRATVDRLETRRVMVQRGPVDVGQLGRWCLMLHAGTLSAAKGRDEETGIDLGRPLPARRFDDAMLTRVAACSPTIACECPHHLADLIVNLCAFERYSEECEMRHAEDAALHAFLHAATAQARSLMEVALARVLEAEGIDVARSS
jgi:DNA-binding transcriptional MerR regulator